MWPVTVHLFATSLNYRLPVYFLPQNNPIAAGTDAFLQVWDGLQAYAFPPFGLIRQVLNKLRMCKGTFLTFIAPFWPQKKWFLEELSCSGSSCAPFFTSRLTQTAPLSSPAPGPPCAAPSCVVTVQRFARHLGLSCGVANQLSLSRRQSSHLLCQHRWECCRAWCTSRGHSVSSPTVAKIADFLLFLRSGKHLSISAIKGYRSTHVSVFKYCVPELLDSFVLRDLIRSFEVECPCPVGPPSWDLVKVLTYLRGSVFKPLSSKPLRIVTMKVSFSVSVSHCQERGRASAFFFSCGFSRSRHLTCLFAGVRGQDKV